MDILTNYRNRITELTDELHHYVHEYNRLLLKEENRKEQHNEYRKGKEEKDPKKKN